MTGLLALLTLAKPMLLPQTAPKLVLLISIDHGRADYIDRFSDLYLPPKSGKTLGGFRWLSETGVRYTDAHHHHVPTFTSFRHSVGWFRSSGDCSQAVTASEVVTEAIRLIVLREARCVCTLPDAQQSSMMAVQ